MNLTRVMIAVAVFASGFAVASHMTSRAYVCSKPVKTITYVRDLWNED